MLYIPIQVYPNERSLRGCVIRLAIFLGLAVAGFANIDQAAVRTVVLCLCAGGMFVCTVNVMAIMTRQPMLKVMDDRFSVYTPFGYAMVRFGEVLDFKKGGLPGMRTLRVDVNQSARPRFQSATGGLLHALTWLGLTNSVAVGGYLLGAQLDSVIRMLENRRQAAVRMETIDDYAAIIKTPIPRVEGA